MTTHLENLLPDGELPVAPIAYVGGQPYKDTPHDLYIPPDALEVILESFEGPLDLLLYLIRRQNMDILAIDVSAVTEQYMEYIRVMEDMRFELAAEYLVMAAMLAEIKSRCLLPKRQSEEGEEDDPRAELIRRLQEYERFKKAAEQLDELPRMDRDFYLASLDLPVFSREREPPPVSLEEILQSLSAVMHRSQLFEHHHIEREKLSTRERMARILDQVGSSSFTRMQSLFTIDEGRMGVVVTLLAILELVKESLLEIVQTEDFGHVYVKAKSSQSQSAA
jgi:segregation and condensation protein A